MKHRGTLQKPFSRGCDLCRDREAIIENKIQAYVMDDGDMGYGVCLTAIQAIILFYVARCGRAW